MIRRLTTYILASVTMMLTAGGLSACTADHLDAPDNAPSSSFSFNPDGSMNVAVELEFPEMVSATRALGDDPNFGNDLSLYLLVFEEDRGEDYSSSRLKQYTKPACTFNNHDDNHSHDKLVKFDLELKPTEKPTSIHIIATNQPDFESMISFGTEEYLISSLYTTDGYEAYWQRIAFEHNIPGKEQSDPNYSDKFTEEDQRKAEAVAQALSHVPMIRNFCRVSVDASAVASTFRVTGLYVLNTVDRGSVAPYVASNPKGDRFVVYYDTDSSNNYVGKSYDDISSQNHVGTLPTGTKLINNSLNPALIDTKNETGAPFAVHFYERPARENSTERTYVIIRGRRTGAAQDSYYKLDLGRIDANFKNNNDVVGRFEYYNLLRNFDYNIKLKSVESNGYGTFAEAAKGAVFNNFSAAIEARNMKSISDGEDMIFVSFTSYVFTQSNMSIILESQFRQNVSNGSGGMQYNNLITYKLDEGDVIKSVSEQKNTGRGPTDLSAWNRYTVEGNAPDNRLRQQTLYIYRGQKASGEYGLYRVITFFAHTPWQFKNIDTFPGLWDSPYDMPSWEWKNEAREIGQSKGSPLTLFFELPAGLPQALFPLVFVIESDRQNIQNAYQGNAVVRSVPAKDSLFYDEATDTPKTSRIQYEKTVTWEEYNSEQTDELVGKGNAIVRCRFLTITDLAQDGVGGSGSEGSSTTTLRVSNKYFGMEDGTPYHQDQFTRNTRTSDPSPRFWDFNSGLWDDVMADMNNSSRSRYTTDSHQGYDELYFIEGDPNATRTLTNATDSCRYVQTSHASDILRHTHTYPQSSERIIHLEIRSTDNYGNPTAPRVEITGITGSNLNDDKNKIESPVPLKETKTTDDKKTYYIYEITVPQDITGLNVDIKAPTGAPNMRFYSIDFYPRWDEYNIPNDEDQQP